MLLFKACFRNCLFFLKEFPPFIQIFREKITWKISGKTPPNQRELAKALAKTIPNWVRLGSPPKPPQGRMHLIFSLLLGSVFTEWFYERNAEKRKWNEHIFVLCIIGKLSRGKNFRAACVIWREFNFEKWMPMSPQQWQLAIFQWRFPVEIMPAIEVTSINQTFCHANWLSFPNALFGSLF